MHIKCTLNSVLVSSLKGPLYVQVCTVRTGVLHVPAWYILYVTLLYCYYLIQDKTTPVYVAAQNGHVEALSLLISAGGNVNTADKVSRSKK